MQTGKIYICDDDQGVQNLREKMLNAQGRRVRQGQQLLQPLAEQEEDFPDLILVDVRLPDVDGLDLLRRIKAQRPAQKVVMMNTFGTVHSTIEAMKQGDHDFLLKSFTSSELYNLVDKLVELIRLLSRLSAPFFFESFQFIVDRHGYGAKLELVSINR